MQMYEVGGARPKMYVENPMLWDVGKAKGKQCISFG